MKKLVNIKLDDNIIFDNKIKDFNDPEKIYLKNKNDVFEEYVYKNTLFNDEYSSVSGVITKVLPHYIEITNDYKEEVKNKRKKIIVKNKEDLIDILIKNSFKNIASRFKNNSIKNIVVSSIDNEIYEQREFIRLSVNYREIMDMQNLLNKIFDVNNSYLVIKNTYADSIKKVRTINGSYPFITLSLVPDMHLIKEKKFLCEYLNIKVDDTLILTTNELYDIYRLINGEDMSKHLISISGNSLKKSFFVDTKLYVSFSELIEKFKIDIRDDDEVFVNGYLRGKKLINVKNLIINKSINSIIINKKENKVVDKCINCFACNKICPYNIDVIKCFNKSKCDSNCTGCGLCNYICPANIDLKDVLYKENK